MPPAQTHRLSAGALLPGLGSLRWIGCASEPVVMVEAERTPPWMAQTALAASPPAINKSSHSEVAIAAGDGTVAQLARAVPIAGKRAAGQRMTGSGLFLADGSRIPSQGHLLR